MMTRGGGDDSWIYDGDAIETNLNVVKSASGNLTVGAGADGQGQGWPGMTG